MLISSVSCDTKECEVFIGVKTPQTETRHVTPRLIKYIFIVYQFKNELYLRLITWKWDWGGRSEQPINSIVCAGTYCEGSVVVLCNNEILSEHFPKIVFPVLSRYLIDFLSMRPESPAMTTRKGLKLSSSIPYFICHATLLRVIRQKVPGRKKTDVGRREIARSSGKSFPIIDLGWHIVSSKIEWCSRKLDSFRRKHIEMELQPLSSPSSDCDAIAAMTRLGHPERVLSMPHCIWIDSAVTLPGKRAF